MLVLAPARREHSGRYQCQGLDLESSASLLSAPRELRVDFVSDVRVRPAAPEAHEGGNLTLTCRAESSQELEFRWLREKVCVCGWGGARGEGCEGGAEVRGGGGPGRPLTRLSPPRPARCWRRGRCWSCRTWTGRRGAATAAWPLRPACPASTPRGWSAWRFSVRSCGCCRPLEDRKPPRPGRRASWEEGTGRRPWLSCPARRPPVDGAEGEEGAGAGGRAAEPDLRGVGAPEARHHLERGRHGERRLACGLRAPRTPP